jgi:hypothetical protein
MLQVHQLSLTFKIFFEIRSKNVWTTIVGCLEKNEIVIGTPSRSSRQIKFLVKFVYQYIWISFRSPSKKYAHAVKNNNKTRKESLIKIKKTPKDIFLQDSFIKEYNKKTSEVLLDNFELVLST